MKKVILIFVIMSTTFYAQNRTDYSPTFFGYVRSWHESNLATSQNEFLVKMARLGVKGKINDYAGYRVLVDFARLGSLSTTTGDINGSDYVTSVSAKFSDVLLDAEAYFKPAEGLSISLGQFKIPFSTDNLRSGASIDFINRPLMTSVAPGLRDVGFMATYKLSSIPVELRAGLFNGSGQNKKENDNTLNYSSRVVVSPIKDLKFAANYYGGKLSSADINIYDFGLDYSVDKFTFAGEYVQRTAETISAETISNAYFIYTYYDFAFSDLMISHILPAFRYEVFDPNTGLDDNEVSRITLGISLQFAKMDFARFRINYELYDYKDGRDNPNKIILEFLGRF